MRNSRLYPTLFFALFSAGSYAASPDVSTGTGNGAIPDENAETSQITADTNTPMSLTGKQAYSGPNPHAELTPEQHLMVALRHHSEGRLAEAMDTLDRAIARHGNDAALLGVRGSFYLEQGSFSAALGDLEKAVDLDPHNAGHRVNRAQAYRRFNRLDEALADLDKAVELDPDLMAARFNRGVLLYAKARYQDAVADFEHCIALQPDTAGPYFNRGVTRDALGDRAGGITDLEKFIELERNAEWKKTAQEQLDAWSKLEKADGKGGS